MTNIYERNTAVEDSLSGISFGLYRLFIGNFQIKEYNRKIL